MNTNSDTQIKQQVRQFYDDIGWQEIEIQRNAKRAPKLILSGEAARLAKKKKLTTWSVSLSHSQSHAIAMVVGIG